MVAGPNSRIIKTVSYVCTACKTVRPQPHFGDPTVIGGAVICPECGAFMQRRTEKIKGKRSFKKHEPRD